VIAGGCSSAFFHLRVEAFACVAFGGEHCDFQDLTGFQLEFPPYQSWQLNTVSFLQHRFE
jgi:hypothetical protein